MQNDLLNSQVSVLTNQNQIMKRQLVRHDEIVNLISLLEKDKADRKSVV